MSKTDYNNTTTQPGRHVIERTVTDGEIGLAIVEMLAKLESVPPHKTTFQLNDYVDAEAVNTLVSSAESDLTISFTVDEYRVTVESDGTVRCYLE